jgi:hypothetical protein
MPLTCPKCEGKRPRLSKIRGLKERVFSAFGTYPVRCEECGHRFYDSVLRLADILFARCPKCYRMDLSTWELKYYSPTQWSLIKLSLGGRRLRCEACRCNFVSFRLTKERSTFRMSKTGQNSTTLNAIDHKGISYEINPDGTRSNQESSDRIEVA